LSETENSNLKQKVYDLEQELERSRPQEGGLDETAKKFVKMLFDTGGSLDFEYVAQMLGVAKGKAAYYRDVLIKSRMIAGVGMIVDDDLGAYELTPFGREFAVRSGLV
jgi:hypothetical protein